MLDSISEKIANSQIIDLSKIKAEEKLSKNINYGDKLEISDIGRAFDKVDKFMNLSDSGRLDLGKMSPDEKEEFLKILAKLLKAGIIGYEELEVDGKKEKHFIVTQLGNERLYGARRWEERHPYDKDYNEILKK